MPGLRPSPKVMTLTEAAAERVREIMNRSERPVAGLRVGVKNGGCAGMEYTMEWADRQEKLDEVVEDKGVRVF
ncbi:MAG: HesB/IscA family protein, partial [Aestuariivirgaceae bacterium]